MNIAILGYGTVGSGVAQVITENQDIIAKKAGQPIRISHILDLREFPGDPFADLVTHDYNDIISDPKSASLSKSWAAGGRL
jgi:homoserine dehydrogenase